MTRAIFFCLFGLMTVELTAALQRRVGNSVQRAIEMTKRRQALDVSTSAQTTDSSSRQKTSQRPTRTERLDVMRLNQLIKSIDKTWAMPRTGSREPMGSNFQYKKTCANIYKSRPAACQQVGFGVLCVNYCYEQGEELNYNCQDLSDQTYCKSNANYESFFSKYRKDSYKVKAFIHQMISRCYATAICSPQGILNATFATKGSGKNVKETAASPTAASRVLSSRKSKPPLNGEVPHKNHKPSIWDRYAAQQPSRPKTQETQPPSDRTNAGVIGPPAGGDEFDGQPRYVPFWQRLLKRKHGNTTATSKRTPATTTESGIDGGGGEEFSGETQAEEEADEVGDEFEEEMLVAVATTTTVRPTISKRRRLKPLRSTTPTRRTTTIVPIYEEVDAGGGEEVNEEIDNNQPQTSHRRHTWKPLAQTTTAASKIDSEFQKPVGPFELVAAASNHEDEGGSAGPAFWNKFQPGRWFQSIHYMTNTG